MTIRIIRKQFFGVNITMASSIIGGVFGSVASVAGAVMNPVCELWQQQGITQAGIACQALNATCWKSGHLVNTSGVVSRLLTCFTPALLNSTAMIIGKKLPACVDVDDEAFCCKEIARIVGIVGSIVIVGVGSAVYLTYTDNAEIAAYALGECVSRSFVNISSCEPFVDAMQWNNTAALVAWGAVNLVSATCGLLAGNCLARNPAKHNLDS